MEASCFSSASPAHLSVLAVWAWVQERSTGVFPQMRVGVVGAAGGEAASEVAALLWIGIPHD